MAFQLPHCLHVVYVSVRQSVSIYNDSELGYLGSCISTVSNKNVAFQHYVLSLIRPVRVTQLLSNILYLMDSKKLLVACKSLHFIQDSFTKTPLMFIPNTFPLPSPPTLPSSPPPLSSTSSLLLPPSSPLIGLNCSVETRACSNLQSKGQPLCVHPGLSAAAAGPEGLVQLA